MKWIILIAILLVLCYVKLRYEIFAVNIPKGQGTEKAEGCFRVMTWNVSLEMVRVELIALIEKQIFDFPPLY